MTKYQVELNEEECISCGACSAVSEENFGVKEDDQKAIVKKPEVDDLGTLKTAADDCPVGCIHIYQTDNGVKKAITGLVGLVLTSSMLMGGASYTKSANLETNIAKTYKTNLLIQKPSELRTYAMPTIDSKISYMPKTTNNRA